MVFGGSGTVRVARVWFADWFDQKHLDLAVGAWPVDNSPHAERVRVLEVEPALAPYDLGLFTLERHLKNPLVNAFWSLLDAQSPNAS